MPSGIGNKAYYPKMKGKKIGLITVCGDTDVTTADPIVHSFKTTCQFTKLRWLGVVQASASGKGEVDRDKVAKKAAYDLGKKGATN